jgi:diguanylate cyclase (GGDEF)-like protein/PAS domain S-box-containing protein
MSSLLQTKRLIWAAVFALVTLVALLSHFSGKRYVAAVLAVEHTLSVEAAISGVLSLMKDAETGERGYILAGDPQFLEPLAAARRDIPEMFSHLQTLTQGDAAQTTHLRTIAGLMREKYAFIDETVNARRDGQLALALSLVRAGRGKQLMDTMRAEFALMSKREAQTLQLRKQQARSAEVTATWGVGIGSLATGVVALLSLLTANRDVQNLRRAAEEVAASEQHYRLLTEHTSDLVRLLDANTGRATYVSPSVERLLGYDTEEFKALPALALIHADDMPAIQRFLRDIKVPVALQGLETYRLRSKAGEYRWFEARWVARQDETGVVVELHTVARDVTERKLAEEQLSAQASELQRLTLRDELTGLYNRRGFLKMAGQSFAEAERDGRGAGLVFIDLNGMKRINDSLGHDMGDAALCDAANVLLAAHRDSDVVARLGGDEFVVFALDVTPRDLDPLRLRLRELCDNEIELRARPYRLSMSVGAAFMPGSATSVAQLLDEADTAMYAQKNARRVAGGVSIPPPVAKSS